MVTLSERPNDALAHEIVAVLEPVKVDAHWHEGFGEIAEPGSDLDDDDLDDGPADGCSVCGGPGAFRECLLDPSAQLELGLALASKWHVCAACLATIAASDPDALKSRLRPEDRTAPYVDVLVGGLLDGIHL